MKFCFMWMMEIQYGGRWTVSYFQFIVNVKQCSFRHTHELKKIPEHWFLNRFSILNVPDFSMLIFGFRLIILGKAAQTLPFLNYMGIQIGRYLQKLLSDEAIKCYHFVCPHRHRRLHVIGGKPILNKNLDIKKLFCNFEQSWVNWKSSINLATDHYNIG